MRILVVSAHFPPNFVSGGTIQPQRLAHGLSQRGHDVSVYAGWLGDRTPLETWTERDANGLALRWIVTTPWIYWHLDQNWDNPPVTADFRRHLAVVQPDIVHFHSMQSLGAGLLAAAEEAGARVVVTMHDFWWFCGRQFLVDRDFQPCPLVVGSGNCSCEVDRPWLDRRSAALREMLDHADLVLAPSAIAARVLAANGVDTRRLQVDENGLPNLVPDPPEIADNTAEALNETHSPLVVPVGPPPLRILYAGGPDKMKGVHILLAAAELLAHRRGWRLHAYGAEQHLRDARLDLDDLPVSVLPPFDPSRADSVFSDNDVLVVPSVMRESHSILTREALSHGLPVVCTDSLGPEEVVEHGRNGFTVPTADPAALANALERLLDEPDLLPRLRSACGAVVIRSLEDQVDGLERTLFALNHSKPAREASGRGSGIGRVLFLCGIDGAPLRYRALLPAEALGMLGIESDVRHYRDPELAELASRADAVVLYRVPATHQILQLIDDIRARGVPVLFDVDDLIFDPDIAAEIPALQILPPDEAALWLEGVRRYRTTMEACDAYIGSTPALCRHAGTVTGLPVEPFDNGVGMALARRSDAAQRTARRPGPLRVGYLSGTRTHDHDWFFVEPAVVEVLDRHPEAELWLGGFLPDSATLERFAKRVVRLPFLPWLEVPTVLRDLDVNLAPLTPDSRFNEAKSAIKWLEAALAATPTVASPTEPFRDAIDHGQNGMLAGSLEEWVEAIEHLLANEGERDRLGHRAQRDALLGWSSPIQGARYRDLLERQRERVRLGSTPSRPQQAWVPLALDEPPISGIAPLDDDRRVVVAPLPVTNIVGGDPDVVTRVRRLATSALASWKTEGGRATAVRAVRFGRRQYQRVRPHIRRLSGSAGRQRQRPRPRPR